METRTLEGKAGEFITTTDSGINIDWEGLAEQEKKMSYGADSRTFNNMMDNIWEYLYNNKVVVYEGTPKSFFATGFGVPLNPRESETMIKYSFANEQEARKYYAQFFKDAQYKIILHQTIGAIKKAEEPKEPIPQ